MSKKEYRLWLQHATQILHITTKQHVQVLAGSKQSDIEVTTADNGRLLGLIVDHCGLISDWGCDDELCNKYNVDDFDCVQDCTGCVLMPGLVDAHTHPVFAGERVHEFEMKLAGATYMQIHEAGGGIHYTVTKTREASVKQLTENFMGIAQRMLKSGTTLMEAKSGYGLNADTEIKMLQAIHNVSKQVPIDISSTFCGAHAIPKGKTAEEATEDVCTVQLPALKQKMEELGSGFVENADVFCEKGVFTVEQTKRILLKAKNELGLRINFHGDELYPTKSAELAEEIQAEAISHLEEASADGIKSMANAGTIAVILPSTAYILRLKSPPVRSMIAAGVAVALGSDFNPNAWCHSMPMIMHLACCICRMSLSEAIVGATLNAAASLGRGASHGALAKGRHADVLVVKATTWQHLIYQFGCASDLIQFVIKDGRIVSAKN